MIPLLLSFVLATAPSSSGDYLPVSLRMDEERLDLGPVFYQEYEVPVPLERAVDKLSHGVLSCQITDEYCDILMGADYLARLYTGGPSKGTATLVDPDDHTTRSIQLSSVPIQENGQWTLDLSQLCELLGVTVDINGDTTELFTSRYWATKLGLNSDQAAKAERATFRSVAWVPDFGITPPAQSLLVWARLSTPKMKPVWTQVYDIDLHAKGGPSAEAILGISANNRETEFPKTGELKLGYEHMRKVNSDWPVQAKCEFIGKIQGRSFGNFVFIAMKDDPGESDREDSALDFIKHNEVQSFAIVGLRQLVERTPIDYTIFRVTEKTSIKELAEDECNMDEGLFRAINGLGNGTKYVLPNQRLARPTILSPTKWGAEQARDRLYKPVGLHEVGRRETGRFLASKWHVKLDWIKDANPYIDVDNLNPGDWIQAIQPKAEPPVLADPIEQFTPTTAFATGKADIYQATDPNSQIVGQVHNHSLLLIIGEKNIGSVKYYRVHANSGLSEVTGMVLASVVRPSAPLKTYSQPTTGLLAVAEKYIGMPYLFGARSTRSGKIDCSHFVAQVFREAGDKAPEPPVHNQESYGDVIWRTDGFYEEGGHRHANAKKGTFDDLELGDRIIIQKGADHPPLRDGFHHTGIYVGPITYGGRFCRYGVIHAGPPKVGVNDLTDGRLHTHLVFVVRGMEKRYDQ